MSSVRFLILSFCNRKSSLVSYTFQLLLSSSFKGPFLIKVGYKDIDWNIGDFSCSIFTKNCTFLSLQMSLRGKESLFLHRVLLSVHKVVLFPSFVLPESLSLWV